MRTAERAAWYGRIALVVGGVFVISCGVLALQPRDASAASPVVTISPGGTLHDGETVAVKVGPNSVFTPNAKVNILECADPGGTTAALPTSDGTCDGNTIQADTVLVAKDGSFSESSYTVYALPNSAALDEQSNYQPVCNQSHACVLYVGQSQNDFTAPKVFSASFSVVGAPGAATTTPSSQSTTATTAPAATTATTATTATSVPPPSPVTSGDSAVSLNSESTAGLGALPNTGPPTELPWMLACGLLLLLGGTAGRRLVLRAQR